MRILVTGSRNLPEEYRDALYAVLDEHAGRERVTVVHGDCPTGADSMADDWADKRIQNRERYPADWSQGKSAGPARNQLMVDLGADVVLAFPYGESRGTQDCVRRAKKAGLNVLIYEVEEHNA